MILNLLQNLVQCLTVVFAQILVGSLSVVPTQLSLIEGFMKLKARKVG